MKIQDLIEVKKIEEEFLKSHYVNETKKKFFKKNGYCWQIPSHSQNEGILLNNWEKDCVIAYIKNKYITAFLIKIQVDNFKGFIIFSDLIRTFQYGSYKIEKIYDAKKVLKVFEDDKENLTIIDNEQLGRFKKLMILDKLDG